MDITLETKRNQHLDELLRSWPFDAQNLSVRIVKGDDGRDVIQMRVDMGILQLETTDRPDGERPEGCSSILEAIRKQELDEVGFVLSDDQCNQVDREFMQFYHRRICWLRLQHYRRAVLDADHTLQLMDAARLHSPDEDWSTTHEQYRPFVWFHRTQAHALSELEDEGAEQAVSAINAGLESIEQIFVEHGAEEHFETDELVVRLRELRESLRREYSVGRTLQERLQEAVESEQYELAARLRDELAKRSMN
ncbi:UvrB/uvrC motif protein [Rosistilla oblonga]|nr:UvrB/uvrC motif protein [Rosistilla oblonga]